MKSLRNLTITLVAVSLILFGSGCRLTYIFHAASGQFRLLNHAVPVEEGLKSESLKPEQKDRLLLVARIKDFGEQTLGLKKTRNYETVYLESRRNPVYTISASPKDRLVRKTWWFPLVGRMPYLGFFDLERARAKKEDLVKEDLDVTLGMADAYSTLGWFKDPVTMNLLEGSTPRLVETILHEMTHTTIYVKGQGAFNEGLANLVGKYGAFLFLERQYGPSHPFTVEARKLIEDERVFSDFLSSLLQRLKDLYDSSISYKEKLVEREIVFSSALASFAELKGRLQTDRFVYFGRSGLNNAYLLSVGLYHQNFHLFEAVFNKEGKSIRDTIHLFKGMAGERGDILERTRLWLSQDAGDKPVSGT